MTILFYIISGLLGLNAGFAFSSYRHKLCTWFELTVAILVVILWFAYTCPLLN
ncbi:unnamed protein product [marine sediment metagenome]|uniref:Uncharacterized protein n=1 Tax=marine sediment metagenome TaxID=412755 RepID=X1CRI0_9ZZZZ